LSVRAQVGVALLALIALATCSCVGSDARLPPEAVAGFDDRRVTYEEFELWVRSGTGDETVALSAPALSGLFEQYLDQLLLVHRARELELIDDRDPARAVRRLLERFPPEPVSDEAVRRHYVEHAADYRRPERVRLRQLLFESRAQAEAALAEIEGGATFGQVVARRFPEVGERAGWLGELSREDLPPELVEPVFGAPAGTVTEVLANDTGFNLFFVEARLPAERVPLEAVAEDIREQLETEARRAQLAQLAAEARERYNLVLASERLPFELRPSRQPPSSSSSP